MPAQPVEIKQLVQSAKFTPVIVLRCRYPLSNPRTRRPSRLPSASGNLCNPFNSSNLCNLNAPYSLDLLRLYHPCWLPYSSQQKLDDITPQPERSEEHTSELQSPCN